MIRDLLPRQRRWGWRTWVLVALVAWMGFVALMRTLRQPFAVEGGAVQASPGRAAPAAMLLANNRARAIAGVEVFWTRAADQDGKDLLAPRLWEGLEPPPEKLPRVTAERLGPGGWWTRIWDVFSVRRAAWPRAGNSDFALQLRLPPLPEDATRITYGGKVRIYRAQGALVTQRHGAVETAPGNVLAVGPILLRIVDVERPREGRPGLVRLMTPGPPAVMTRLAIVEPFQKTWEPAYEQPKFVKDYPAAGGPPVYHLDLPLHAWAKAISFESTHWEGVTAEEIAFDRTLPVLWDLSRAAPEEPVRRPAYDARIWGPPAPAGAAAPCVVRTAEQRMLRRPCRLYGAFRIVPTGDRIISLDAAWDSCRDDAGNDLLRPAGTESLLPPAAAVLRVGDSGEREDLFDEDPRVVFETARAPAHGSTAVCRGTLTVRTGRVLEQVDAGMLDLKAGAICRLGPLTVKVEAVGTSAAAAPAGRQLVRLGISGDRGLLKTLTLTGPDGRVLLRHGRQVAHWYTTNETKLVGEMPAAARCRVTGQVYAQTAVWRMPFEWRLRGEGGEGKAR